MGVWAKFPFLKTSFFKRGEQYILLHVYKPQSKALSWKEEGKENMVMRT